MLFHTFTFLAFFIAFLMCYLPARGTRWAVPVIVVFSSVFYGSWDWRFLPLLWVTIVVDFTVAWLMAKTQERRKRRYLLWTSIVCNLGILGYFKYWNFLVHSFLGDSPLAQRLDAGTIILPLGISFYVFQSMSYIIDVYRGKQAPLNHVLDFAAFVTFFPHLIAGPIQRIQQLVPQILNPDRITIARAASGIFLFLTGLFRKSLGDTLAGFHDPVFSKLADAHPAFVVMAVLTFGLQIYLDFSGYSEMAVGIARVLGIDLITNFEAPYLSSSIRNFWRRWHISLSLWLRDYLYISLGGSRSGLVRQVANVLVTMTICGLWHGAGWNFAIWGLLHGIYLGINAVFTKATAGWRPRTRPAAWLGNLAGWAVTFIAANYAWVYFRLASFDETVVANRKILEWLSNPNLPAVPPGIYVIFLIVALFDVATRRTGEIFPYRLQLTPVRATAYGLAAAVFLVFGIVLAVGQPTAQFIYFQF